MNYIATPRKVEVKDETLKKQSVKVRNHNSAKYELKMARRDQRREMRRLVREFYRCLLRMRQAKLQYKLDKMKG